MPDSGGASGNAHVTVLLTVPAGVPGSVSRPPVGAPGLHPPTGGSLAHTGTDSGLVLVTATVLVLLARRLRSRARCAPSSDPLLPRRP